MSTFGDGLYQYGGQPVGGMLGASPFGKAFYVDYENGVDGNDGLSPNKAKKTLSGAISAVVSNRGDTIYIDPYSTVVETAMVTLDKNRVTIVGGAPPYGHYGQGVKVSVTATAGATNIGTFKNTGIRNKFIGLKFLNASTVAEGLYCFVEGGEFSQFYNCEFYKSTDLDETGASEFVNNGDSPMFYNCTFGSTANIIADNKIRANMLLTQGLAGTGKVCRDAYLENCLFFSKCAGTEHVDVYGANADDVERMLVLNGCMFISNALGAATPAHAVGFGAAQTAGSVLLKNCTSVDHTVMAEASVGIYVDGAVPTFATTGVAKAS
jgi:hypothetical protein